MGNRENLGIFGNPEQEFDEFDMAMMEVDFIIAIDGLVHKNQPFDYDKSREKAKRWIKEAKD